MSGLKLNESQCQFGVTEITFLGDKLSGKGVETDRSKVQAILDMPAPMDKKKGVLRAIGMVNFLGKFIPNLSAKTVTIRGLLQKDRGFEWTDRHNKEWEKLKETLTREPVLTFFDPSRKTKNSKKSPQMHPKTDWAQCCSKLTTMATGVCIKINDGDGNEVCPN